MSKNRKAVKKAVLAKQFSTIRKQGGHGPAKTTPKHGKKASFSQLKKAKRGVVTQSTADVLNNAYAGKD